MSTISRHWPGDNIDVVICTDSEIQRAACFVQGQALEGILWLAFLASNAVCHARPSRRMAQNEHREANSSSYPRIAVSA